MSDKKVIESLKIVLADSYMLLLKTQNYHWNVTGPNFKTFHLMFEEQYNDLFAAVDVVAERIRALGEKAPGTFATYTKISNIKEGDKNLKANDMIKDLAADQDKMVKHLLETQHLAQGNDDEATVDIIIERLQSHEKNAWMLKSSLES